MFELCRASREISHGGDGRAGVSESHDELCARRFSCHGHGRSTYCGRSHHRLSGVGLDPQSRCGSAGIGRTNSDHTAAHQSHGRSSVGCGRAHRSGCRTCHGSIVAIHRVAVGVTRAHDAGHCVVCLAYSSHDVCRSSSRFADHGHTDHDGHGRCLSVVALRTVLWHGGHARHAALIRAFRVAARPHNEHLSRDSRRRDHLYSARSLARATFEALGVTRTRGGRSSSVNRSHRRARRN